MNVLRRVEGVNDTDGFVLAASKDWLLLKDANALQPDGFWLFRRDTVTSIHYSEFHKFKQRMMKLSRLLDRIHPPPDIVLGDIISVLQWFQKAKRLCILFTENKNEWWRVHCAITDASPKQLKLQSFDGAGRWQRVGANSRWKPSVITAIRFDSHYLRLYEKHSKKERPE